MLNLAFTYADLEYFLLIVVRVTCFIFIAPFFSMSNTPNRVKIGLGVLISVLIYGSTTRPEIVYTTLTEYAIKPHVGIAEGTCGPSMTKAESCSAFVRRLRRRLAASR